MDIAIIKQKYSKYLDSNFKCSSDKDEVCKILSKVSNQNLELIVNKSQDFLEAYSNFSNDKIDALKLFANSGTDKIHALSKCAPLFEHLWPSDKESFLNSLGRADAGKIYAISLSNDYIKNISYKDDKKKFLDRILNAKDAKEAYDLIGYNDTTSNLRYHETYDDYRNYDYSYIPVYETYPSQSSYQEYKAYPIYQNNSSLNSAKPVINNYYYNDKPNDYIESNSQINIKKSSNNDSDSNESVGILDYIGAGFVVTGIAAITGGIASYLFDSDSSSQSSIHQQISNNNSKSLDSYKNDYYQDFSTNSYDDLPPAYSSIYPDLISY